MDQIKAPTLIAVLGLICFASSVPGMDRTMYAEEGVSIIGNNLRPASALTDVETSQSQRILFRVVIQDFLLKALQTCVAQVSTVEVCAQI